jgi:malonyl-CoA O-methyltransferase
MIKSAVMNNKSLNYFDDAAGYYHKNAAVQKEVADRLIASLKPWQDILPPGPIIELGCGTGFVSKAIQQLFEQRELIFTDSAPNMVETCRRNIGKSRNISFETLDAEQIPVDKPTYAMSISSFSAQWFSDPAYTLGQWIEVTKAGGLLLAAFPGNECFPEWKRHAEALGLPFTANPLPDTEEMVVKLSSGSTQVDYYEDTITQQFKRAGDFFRHLKKIGAGRQLHGRHLTAKEMRLLIDYWNEQANGKVTVSWHVVFLAVKKNMV